MPSPRPTAPTPSVRFGLTETDASGSPSAERLEPSPSRCGASGGCSAATTTSTLRDRASRASCDLGHDRRAGARSTRRRGARRRRPGTACRGPGSPAAPSSASATACAIDVGIGVPDEPGRVVDRDARRARAARRRRRRARRSRARRAAVTRHSRVAGSRARTASTTREVGDRRDLQVARIAGDDDHGPAGGFDERGVVGRVAAGGVRRAQRSAANACGVCTATSPSRSTVSTTRSPSTRLSVSATAIAGHRARRHPPAPCRSRARTARAMRADAPRRARRRSRRRERSPPARRARRPNASHRR